MEGREDGYTFSDPYMLNEQVIVVKAGSDISDFAGLSGKTVMTQVDSAALDVLEGDQPPPSRAVPLRPSATTTTPSCSLTPA